MRQKKTVALDFDGVLHSYTSPWTAPEDIKDGPVPGALEAVRGYITDGLEVVVFSARAKDPKGKDAIEEWLWKHDFPVARMSIETEKPQAVLYIDDRGFRFEGTFPTPDEVRKFKPWNR